MATTTLHRRISSTSGVSRTATMPEDQGGSGGDGTWTPPVDTHCSNIAAVGSASFSGTSHSDSVHGCVASTPVIANGARHLDSFQFPDQGALVNDSHLRHSPRYILDSSAMNLYEILCVIGSTVYNIAPKLMTAQMGNVPLPSPESHWQAIDASS